MMRRSMSIEVPPLVPARTVTVAGRGEFFVRYAPHADVAAPTVLLLHGWTSSSDLNFFTAYEELCSFASVIGIDHRGHGRGLRPDEPFTLEDCADDAAAVVRELGITPVVVVGYSMGGPIAMLLARRHPECVSGLVLQATAMEWRATRRERTRWHVSRALGPVTRRFVRPRMVRFVFSRRFPRRHSLRPFLGWMLAEWRRNDPWHMAQAARAISRFDARGWIATLGVPTAVVLTTRDQLVPPRKQRALAEAASAQVVALDGDHFVNVLRPDEFSAATCEAVRRVLAVTRVAQSAH